MKASQFNAKVDRLRQTGMTPSLVDPEKILSMKEARSEQFSIDQLQKLHKDQTRVTKQMND